MLLWKGNHWQQRMVPGVQEVLGQAFPATKVEEFRILPFSAGDATVGQ